jgi:hypothetical protein
MKGITRHGVPRRLGFWAALLVSALSLKADPIDVNAEPIFEVGTIISITLAIFLEAMCIWLLLRRWRTPRLFILWLMGMHLLTYPVFLGLLWLSIGVHPALAVATGEGLVVFIEGSLIYLICRFVPSAKSSLPLPSVGKTLFASLVGNICSAAAFPLLSMLTTWLAFTVGRSVMD